MTARIEKANAMTAPAPATLPALDAFVARAEERALLWQAGEFEHLPDAVDPLWAYAEDSGLVAELGADAVQAVLAKAFEAQDRERTKSVAALPFIDMSTWDKTEAPPRPRLILDHIPSRQPTLISGPGGIGKSILLLQLLAATTLEQPWLNSLWPKQGPTIYLGAEDERDELRRRLIPILQFHRKHFSDLAAGGFHALAYAGEDAVLASFDRTHRIKPSDLFSQLYNAAHSIKPSVVVVDAISDVYLGDEIKREQVRQFGSLMRKLAIDCNTAVIMVAHPSVSGMKSGSGLSGSTQWHNTVRARVYFTKPTAATDDDNDDDDTAPDNGLRELRFHKNQFGPLARNIELRWSNGLWLPTTAEPTEEERANATEEIDRLFLSLLRRFANEGRDVSPKKSPTYALAKFAETPDAKRLRATSAKLVAAMERLFAAGKLKAVPDGPPSRMRQRLVEVMS